MSVIGSKLRIFYLWPIIWLLQFLLLILYIFIFCIIKDFCTFMVKWYKVLNQGLAKDFFEAFFGELAQSVACSSM